MFKVDDGFYDHPKVRSIPRGAPRKGAVSLWTLAGSWCDRYLKDGLVPAFQIEELGGTRKDAQSLVEVGLWHQSGHGCESCADVPRDHYLYHEWEKWNDLKKDVQHRRDKARERMRKLRAGELGKGDDSSNVTAMFPGSSGEQGIAQ